MKEIIDCHTHCNFSHDSTAPARDMIESALAKGLSYFAITDHCDKDCEVLPGYEYIRQIDLPRRRAALKKSCACATNTAADSTSPSG